MSPPLGEKIRIAEEPLLTPGSLGQSLFKEEGAAGQRRGLWSGREGGEEEASFPQGHHQQGMRSVTVDLGF